MIWGSKEVMVSSFCLEEVILALPGDLGKGSVFITTPGEAIGVLFRRLESLGSNILDESTLCIEFDSVNFPSR